QAQRHLRLAAVALAERLAAEAQTLHALGDRPQVQPEAAADRQAAEGFQHARLVPGLDDDQAHARVEHQAQVMDIVLHTDSLWGGRRRAQPVNSAHPQPMERRLWTACSARSSTATF